MTPRFARQARLVEVGEAGQLRIEAAACTVRGSDLAAEVEARYLAGAGVGALAVEDDAVARRGREVGTGGRFSVARASSSRPGDAGSAGADPEWLSGMAPAARDVARGAHRALRQLKRILEGAP